MLHRAFEIVGKIEHRLALFAARALVLRGAIRRQPVHRQGIVLEHRKGAGERAHLGLVLGAFDGDRFVAVSQAHHAACGARQRPRNTARDERADEGRDQHDADDDRT